MIFESLTLKNFRQFKGEHTYIFSQEKGITLIVASNGVGKTTFLQAFRYCFYGESPNYLKLPRAREILNNNIKQQMKELDKKSLEVSIYFSNGGKKYFASRSKGYIKKNNRLIEDNDNPESFTVSEYINNKGYVPKSKEDSEELIRQILPPGLVHIYMFDGERMEKRVETQEYKEDLKESITSMLGLKKLERALELIGTENHSSKALGMLKSKLKGQSQEHQDLLNDDKKYRERLEQLENEKESLQKTLNQLNADYQKYNKYQAEINKNKEAISKKNQIEKKVAELDQEINKITNDGLPIATRALKNKLLLAKYKEFKQFMEKQKGSNPIYQSLHIDTLKDIIYRRKCICGTKFNENDEIYQTLESLKDHVLPHNNAVYLSKIQDKFNNAVELKEQEETLENLKKQFIKTKRLRKEKLAELEEINRDIKETEIRDLGDSPQEKMNELNNKIADVKANKSSTQTYIDSINATRKKHEKQLKELEKNSEHNKKVNRAVNALSRVYKSIQSELYDKQEQTRSILETNMNQTMNAVLNRNFKVGIDKNFELSITENGITQTDILSTGQSVIVSLSFIDALLKTFDEVKGKGHEKEHGVLMDAALSNVDERFISKICDSILNDFEQLIFMSFKRQLRHEFYEGIKGNIGKVYHLQKTEDNTIDSEEKSIDGLDEFIHEIEGADYSG